LFKPKFEIFDCYYLTGTSLFFNRLCTFNGESAKASLVPPKFSFYLKVSANFGSELYTPSPLVVAYE